MATEPEVRFFLSERDAQSLLVPLGSSGKIKVSAVSQPPSVTSCMGYSVQYTCVALSASYIALGANTGGVYCFHRDHRYIQLLANKVAAAGCVRGSCERVYVFS